MALDSVAVFNDRVCELGLSAHAGAGGRFELAGWRSYGDLAFATSHTPGNPEGPDFDAQVVVPGLGLATHAVRPELRRLFFEAFTLTSADSRRRGESTSDDPPRKVPTAEREERRTRVASRLTGLSLRDELDCSNRLIDLAIDMYENNALMYIGPADCTKKGDVVGWG